MAFYVLASSVVASVLPCAPGFGFETLWSVEMADVHHNSWLCPSHSRKDLGLREACAKDSGDHIETTLSGLCDQVLCSVKPHVPIGDRVNRGPPALPGLLHSRWLLGSEEIG